MPKDLRRLLAVRYCTKWLSNRGFNLGNVDLTEAGGDGGTNDEAVRIVAGHEQEQIDDLSDSDDDDDLPDLDGDDELL